MHASPPRYNIRHLLWCFAMFVAESVCPQFGQAFSLGLYTLARPSLGLTFPLTPPSASFAVQALTCLAIFASDFSLPHFQHLLFADSDRRLPHAFLCVTFVFSLWKLSLHRHHLKLKSCCNSPCILFLWMSRPPLLLQIFPHTSQWNASYLSLSQPKVFCAFLNHVSVLPIFPLLTTSVLPLSGFCSSKGGFSLFLHWVFISPSNTLNHPEIANFIWLVFCILIMCPILSNTRLSIFHLIVLISNSLPRSCIFFSCSLHLM